MRSVDHFVCCRLLIFKLQLYCTTAESLRNITTEEMPWAMVVAVAVVLLSYSGQHSGFAHANEIQNVIFLLYIILSLCYYYFAGTANGLTKQWTPNVDFEDPNNWDAKHVPSSVDVTVFQEDTVVPVVLPSAGINVCELVLPVNGQLILEPNANIVVSTSSKDAGGCTGQS